MLAFLLLFILQLYKRFFLSSDNYHNNGFTNILSFPANVIVFISVLK